MRAWVRLLHVNRVNIPFHYALLKTIKHFVCTPAFPDLAFPLLLIIELYCVYLFIFTRHDEASFHDKDERDVLSGRISCQEEKPTSK